MVATRTVRMISVCISREGTDLVISSLREEGLRLVVTDARVNDDIVTFLPVHRCGDLVLIAELESYAACKYNTL